MAITTMRLKYIYALWYPSAFYPVSHPAYAAHDRCIVGRVQVLILTRKPAISVGVIPLGPYAIGNLAVSVSAMVIVALAVTPGQERLTSPVGLCPVDAALLSDCHG